MSANAAYFHEPAEEPPRERQGEASLPEATRPSELKPGLLTLTIKDKSALYMAYMPYLRNGGIFVPTSTHFQLGDEVFMLLNLGAENEKIPVAGRVVWVTPKRPQGRRIPGIGVQFSGQDGGQTQRKIETWLAGALAGEKASHTM